MYLLIDIVVIGACAGLAAWAVFHLCVTSATNSQKCMEEIRLAKASLDSKVQKLVQSLTEAQEQQYSRWVFVFKGLDTGRIYIEHVVGDLDEAQAEWPCRKKAQDEMDKLEGMELLSSECIAL